MNRTINPINGRTIPNPIPLRPEEAKYLVRGTVNDYAPTPAHRLCMLITGGTDTGKTTFLLSNPDLIVADFLGFTSDVRHRSALAVTMRDRRLEIAKNPSAHNIDLFHNYRDAKGQTKSVGRPATVIDAFDWFIASLCKDADAGKRPRKMVGIDSLDAMQNAMIAHLSALPKYNKYRASDFSILEYGEKGSGWGKVIDEIIRRLNAISNAGYGLLMTTDLIEKEGQPGIKRSVLAPKVHGIIRGACHYIIEMKRRTTLEVETRTIKVRNRQGGVENREQEIKRSKRTVFMAFAATETENAASMLKARHVDRLPPVLQIPIEGGWEVFKTAYQRAITQEENENGTATTPEKTTAASPDGSPEETGAADPETYSDTIDEGADESEDAAAADASGDDAGTEASTGPDTEAESEEGAAPPAATHAGRDGTRRDRGGDPGRTPQSIRPIPSGAGRVQGVRRLVAPGGRR